MIAGMNVPMNMGFGFPFFSNNNNCDEQLQEITRYGEISKKIGECDSSSIYIGFEDENPVEPYKKGSKVNNSYDKQLNEERKQRITDYLISMGFSEDKIKSVIENKNINSYEDALEYVINNT